jgi:hypothetical protein
VEAGPAVSHDNGVLEVAGQEFKVTILGRVPYPATGTTKADVVGCHYRRRDRSP